ncbi:MAG: LysM peptidoglycan-binding domain-containing protein, partial [Alphaproteobacteria bacterium]
AAPVEPAAIAEPAAPVAPKQALVVLSEPGKPSQVLQESAPAKNAPAITFSSVDYDDEGAIILAGKVDAGADIRAYLSGVLLGDTQADDKGDWVLRATRDIAPGAYELRLDQISGDGKVLARVTAPFERASPEAVALAKQDGEIIIQPGDNLWTISRALYGRGTQYTVIFEANRNQIGNPNLIFPGQVFMTPGAMPVVAVGTSG